MRIVAIADTHQFHDELHLPDGDVLVCAGDVGRAGDEEEIDGFLRWFVTMPHRHKIFVPGNHDGCLEVGDPALFRHRYPNVTMLIDEACVIDGVRFWGSPWTPTFFDWAFMRDRGPPLAERWALIPDDTQVLITHGPPKGVLDDVSRYRARVIGSDGVASDDDVVAGDEDLVGCADLMTRVRQVRPALHLFGHIHSQRGAVNDGGITFVNCTTNECELPPTVIDIAVDSDTDVDAATVNVLGG